MFAPPYPREFLGCICLAKNSISSSTPLTAWELSRLAPFAYNAFPVRGHLQIPCLCRWPRVSPEHPPRPWADGQPSGWVRPAPPGRGTLLCPGRVVSD